MAARCPTPSTMRRRARPGRGFRRSLRLPVILIRPTGGASSLSDRIGAVVRDPLHGLDVDCPLEPETRMPVASARAAAQALADLYDAPTALLQLFWTPISKAAA